MAEAGDIDKKTREAIAVGGVLTGLFDGTDPKAFRDVSNVKFYDKDNKDNPFKTYKEFGNAPVTDTSQVAITVAGEKGKKEETLYFKKIYQSVPDNKAANQSDKPKVITWARTDKDGNLFVNDKGMVERYDTYQGFKGDPNADPKKNKQTFAARSAEKGELYSPTSYVADCIKEADKAFDEEVKRSGKEIKGVETHIVAHSFGSANAVAAGGLMGDRAKDVLLLEPIAASGNLKILQDMKTDELAKKLNIPQKEAEKVSEELKKIEQKTTSVRSVDKDGHLSNSAMMEVFDPKKHGTIEKLHTKNVGDNPLSNLSSTGAKGRDGDHGHNHPDDVDKKNDMLGKRVFVYTGQKTLQKYPGIGIEENIDRPHKVVIMVGAANDNAPMAPSIKELKEKIDALNKKPEALEKPKAPEEQSRSNTKDMKQLAASTNPNLPGMTLTASSPEGSSLPERLAGVNLNTGGVSSTKTTERIA